MKALQTWYRICAPHNELRHITLSEDKGRRLVGITIAATEGPDESVYLPINDVLPLAKALEYLAALRNKRYCFIPCEITGQSHLGQPASVHGAAYLRSCFVFRVAISFKFRNGLQLVTLASARQAQLIASLLRNIHKKHNGEVE